MKIHSTTKYIMIQWRLMVTRVKIWQNVLYLWILLDTVFPIILFVNILSVDNWLTITTSITMITNSTFIKILYNLPSMNLKILTIKSSKEFLFRTLRRWNQTVEIFQVIKCKWSHRRRLSLGEIKCRTWDWRLLEITFKILSRFITNHLHHNLRDMVTFNLMQKTIQRGYSRTLNNH